jgi:Xaa-Pro dipeptidase
VSPPAEFRFSPAEYARRLTLTRERMAGRGLDALLVFSPANICYLAGHHSVNLWDYQCLLVPLESDPLMILWEFERGRFEASSWLDRRLTYRTHEDPIRTTRQAVEQAGLRAKRIGLETGGRYLSVEQYRRLTEALGDGATADGAGIVEGVRVVKSAEEIAVIREAAAITDRGMKAALEAVREGALDHDVAAEGTRALVAGGSHYMCIEPIVAVGPKAGLAHSTYGGTRVGPGDTVFIELGACVHRYTAPLMRTAVAGPPSDAMVRLAACSRGAIEAMLELMRPGARACDVAAAGRRAIAPVESDVVFHYIFGYSVGVGFPPSWLEESNFYLRSDNPAELRAGMVLHLPLTLRIFGRLGVGFSETVLVTPGGAEPLSALERSLSRR